MPDPQRQTGYHRRPHSQAGGGAGGGEADDDQIFAASSDTLHSWGNMSYVYIPLQDLKNGRYGIDVELMLKCRLSRFLMLIERSIMRWRLC
jgi:hypothetical protein